jgi:TonB family protein
MGYQALLFCPDEKLSFVVRQVFGELDFSVELVHEPFAAVKKLMAQHYDVIVVDNENEQNAALVFKSARNSGSNHSSLAIALVAGQAGIAKAYRIGANLVLTKPINVEQAKGTLRVARGLLRKTSEAAAASAASAAVPEAPANSPPVSAISLSQPDRRHAPRLTLAPVRPETSESEPAPSADAWPAEASGAFAGTLPETTPAAAVEAIAPRGATSNRITIAAEAGSSARQPGSPGAFKSAIDDDAADHGVTRRQVRSEAATSLDAAASSSARDTVSVFPSSIVSAASTGSATASATAPEFTAPANERNRIVESQPAGPSSKYPSSAVSRDTTLDSAFTAAAANDGAPFAGMSKEGSGGLSANKKMLIAAVIVLALAALGYLGYGLLIRSNAIAAPHSVNLPQDSERPATSLASESSTPAPSAGSPNMAITPSTVTVAANESSGPPHTVPGSPNVIRIALNPATNAAEDGVSADTPEARKPASKPLFVKSNGRGTKSSTEESAPQLPVTVASSKNDLSGVMSSESSNIPRLSLKTIKISQGVSEGLLIKQIPPKYPRAALLSHAQGAVQIEATINKEGFVTHPKVLRGDPVLAHAALDAVNQWRYKPYYLDGMPVEIQTQITVNFRPN